MEGLDLEQAVGAGGRLDQIRQHRRERRVEADEERPIALLREPPRLLGGEHRLAGPGTADDRGPPLRPQRVQQAVLALGQAHDLALAADDLVAEHRVQLERLGQRRDEQVDRRSGPARRVSARPLQSSNARSRKARSSRRPSSVSRKVDWSAMRSTSTSGPRRPSRPRHRVELDVREGDGLTGDRVQAGRPVRQFAKLADQRVPAVGGLLERRSRQAFAGAPAAGPVASDLAGLDLDARGSRGPGRR